jgi:ketosteroid isomerase-like protein
MKPLFVSSLIMVSVLSFFGQAQADTASVQQTLMQMERDWAQAGIKNDTATVDKFVADDWVGINFEGTSITKAEGIADMKSGASTAQSYEFGPMKVRVFGNTAVVTGSDTEKSTYKGKDTSGKYVWTDVWVMRDGRWQAVASQSVKVGK